jgi:hypothetical protein
MRRTTHFSAIFCSPERNGGQSKIVGLANAIS